MSSNASAVYRPVSEAFEEGCRPTGVLGRAESQSNKAVHPDGLAPHQPCKPPGRPGFHLGFKCSAISNAHLMQTIAAQEFVHYPKPSTRQMEINHQFRVRVTSVLGVKPRGGEICTSPYERRWLDPYRRSIGHRQTFERF